MKIFNYSADYKKFTPDDKVKITFIDGQRVITKNVRIISIDSKRISFEDQEIVYECVASEILEINDNTKFLVPIFCLYTILVPLFYFLFIINDKYGVSCGDGCHTHSYFIHYLILVLFCIAGALNILFFSLAYRKLISKKICLLSLILNCLYLGYVFCGTINVWFILGLFPLEIITIPIQFILLWYVFFREFLQKEKRVFLSALPLGIITCALFFLFLLID